jgi:uncharacterized coiled-coil protein SlyX
MAITDEDRDRLYATLRRQLGEDDARTLIAMLSSNDPDSLASRAQLDAGIERLDARLAGLDARVEGLDVRVTGLEAAVAGLEAKVSRLGEEMRDGFAGVRAELREAAGEQTRTFVTWMFALLTVYTVMAGSFVALGTLIVAK